MLRSAAGLDSERQLAGCELFRRRREDCADDDGFRPRRQKLDTVILEIGDGPFRALCCAGARDSPHADLTDRDREESSRRAISAWVRTNPQTQVRIRERRWTWCSAWRCTH
jgi:hypothetical protein